ncbi:MAG: hypothetical protein BroJett006_12220 [Betaproteobacteria bacterium]|nr:MAG: hypothetical protein BroJett006_12220 [Betaproteobacteria bacterium]
MNLMKDNFFIKAGYVAREKAEYFEDAPESRDKIVHQPDVYALAGYLARKFECTHILDIGCGRAEKLADLYPEFEVVGIDIGPNIDYCKAHYPFGKWHGRDLEQAHADLLPPDMLQKTLLVCSDVIEHLTNPVGLLNTLQHCLVHAPVAIVTTPERDLVRGPADSGPPANPAHVREWNLAEFQELLGVFSFKTAFLGLTCNNDRHYAKKTILAILHGGRMPLPQICTNDSFKVVAIMTAYNESDIIYPSLCRLIKSGVAVYLIDNWSTDGTASAASPLLGKGLIAIERFPPQNPSQSYDWQALLKRVEEVAQTLEADWFIHHDVDEIRESPWPELSLRDTLCYADRLGFNAVDHTVLDFRPIDDNFPSGGDFGAYFRHWEFGRRRGHFVQIKAWKNPGARVSLAASGGHEAIFPDRRVFPYKFLLRHYPVRSQRHGEKKILVERKPRFNRDEKVALGWHSQYDHIRTGHNFIHDPSSLILFDTDCFYRDYLVERTSGIGILRREARNGGQRGFIGTLKKMLHGFVKRS